LTGATAITSRPVDTGTQDGDKFTGWKRDTQQLGAAVQGRKEKKGEERLGFWKSLLARPLRTSHHLKERTDGLPTAWGEGLVRGNLEKNWNKRRNATPTNERSQPEKEHKRGVPVLSVKK